MSELRQVDRVILKTLRQQNWALATLCPAHNFGMLRERNEEIDALLTEQPDQDEAGDEKGPYTCERCGETIANAYVCCACQRECTCGAGYKVHADHAYGCPLYTGLAPEPVEPDAPQEVEDCHDPKHTINNYRGTPCPFCQRDQYKEKLDNLVGLVREYDKFHSDFVNADPDNVERRKIAMNNTLSRLLGYAEEVGGSG